jgi:hypothetical protein
VNPTEDESRAASSDRSGGSVATRVRTLITTEPVFWPHFNSSLRSLALTARIGRVLGIFFTVCFITGLLSHYQYTPWHWLPEPATPIWGYRLTQGTHVITGIVTIPLLLLKLWSVYHKFWQWPAATSLVNGLERLSIGVLVATSVLELVTGLMNVLQWYAWPWGFVGVHYWLAWIIFGSLVLHIAVKLPLIREGLSTPLSTTPTPDTKQANGIDSDHHEDGEGGISRRGVLIAAGAGVGVVAITTVGQIVTPLEPIALLAPRKTSAGPQTLPVNKTAAAAGVLTSARSPQYRFQVSGPRGFVLTLTELEALDASETVLPIACVEGWSHSAHWRGPKLLDLVTRAGGSSSSKVAVGSLEKDGYNVSHLTGSQLEHALLATHLNGERLDIDHGYPLRLIAPDRAGVLQTKWLDRVVIT